MAEIGERLAQLRARIRRAAEACGREADAVRLVAVAKTFPAEAVRRAAQAGAREIGENYIQEAREKIAALEGLGVRWHFIGHLQTNKAKYAVRLFDLIQTVDSLRLAAEIDRQARKAGKLQEVLVQVNIGGEATKSGVPPAEAGGLVRAISAFENLSVRGLMAIPPFFDAPELARPYFAALRALRDRIRAEVGDAGALPELSMGMTGDFEAAVAEGATIVRIGTAIFGARA
jgi:hypothetical protein